MAVLGPPHGEQIRAALKKYGCSEAQGWLFGRAVSAETVRTFLEMKDQGVPGADAAKPGSEDARFTPRVRRNHL